MASQNPGITKRSKVHILFRTWEHDHGVREHPLQIKGRKLRTPRAKTTNLLSLIVVLDKRQSSFFS